MSTQNVNQQTGTFNAAGMNAYNSFIPQYMSGMSQFAQNPLQSSFFNTQVSMQNQQNRAAFGSMRNQMNQNMAAGGYVGNMPAFMQDQNLNISRGLASANAGSFNNLLLGSNQLRMSALNSMGNFRPLQTGQTTTQTQSGLGTWLPQVAGMGLSALSGGLGGGLGGASFSPGSYNPFLGGGGFAVGAAGLGPMPGQVQPSTYSSPNTLLGPT